MTIASNIGTIQGRIERAARACGRDPNAITLLAASKTRSVDEVREAAAAGVRVFGENYVQELAVKAPAVPDVEWHLIGHLQKNKARKLAGLVRAVQTIDSESLADVLSQHTPGIDVLIEVNIAGEASKSGCPPEVVLALARHIAASALALRGLMAIPPAEGDRAPWFRALRQLRDDVAGSLGAPLPVLSLGMSDDLEAAIACGSTLVRVGTGIFGPRKRVV